VARPSSEVQAAVRAKVESAEISRDPFPHLMIPDLLPEAFFQRLATAIPPLESFEQSKRGIKADLPLRDENPYFTGAPEGFREVWRQLRDEMIRAVVGPILAQRLENEIRAKYADLFSPEIADQILEGGLVTSDGRIMSRKAGYWLKPHTDSAHFAVTCLLYFTVGRNETSGALCLFRPERAPELRTVSTYYPEKEEGIGVELVKTIPIRANLFVAFLNGRRSVHGVRIDPSDGSAASRLSYQAHILPRHNIRHDAESFVEDLPDPAARRRWRAFIASEKARAAQR
jgi:hypothetical protein